MSRRQWLLIGVIVIESIVGSLLLARHLRQPTPPLPDLAAVDKLAAVEIRALAARCRTTAQWASLGEVYLATGFFPEAEACLREAAARDPSCADLAFKHGFALERLGKLEDANTKYEIAIGLNHPRNADCWYYIGKNHLRLEHATEADAAFKQAGNLPGARFELALLNARAGQKSDAEAEAKRLAGEFALTYPPVSLLYRLALARKDQTAADAHADSFVRKPKPLPTPIDTEVNWVFGIANGVGQNRLFGEAGQALSAGQFESAEKKLRSALAAGWNPEVADKLAEVLFGQSKKEEALAVLGEASERGRPSFELLWRLGQAHEAMGQKALTLKLWQRAAQVATGPGAKELWQDLAGQYDRLGDTKMASAFQGRAALAAGIAAVDSGQPASALQTLKKAVEHEPQLAHAWYWLGEALRANGQPAEAREAYQRCLQINTNHGRARRALKLLGGAAPAEE